MINIQLLNYINIKVVTIILLIETFSDEQRLK